MPATTRLRATGGGRRCRVLLLAVSLALSYLNYRGLSVIGNTAVASTVYIIVPFVVMAALAAPQVQPRNWLLQDWGAVQWGSFINVMFWCPPPPPRPRIVPNKAHSMDRAQTCSFWCPQSACW